MLRRVSSQCITPKPPNRIRQRKAIRQEPRRDARHTAGSRANSPSFERPLTPRVFTRLQSANNWGTQLLFDRYIGIDYSGAQTPDASLPALRIYVATPVDAPSEVPPPDGLRKYWTRRGIATWLEERLAENRPSLVGIDHGFSFPLEYFVHNRLPFDWTDWTAFLEDFHRHWPTDKEHMYVDFIRDGLHGNAAARSGDPRWRRITEIRARTAKSVFRFIGQGTVAKSTHAGLPWLLHLRRSLHKQVHFWPFDGWDIPDGRSGLTEVYPSLWSKAFPQEDRNPHQHDAYSVAAWMREADRDARLPAFFHPHLTAMERHTAEIEGWILGII